MRTTVILEGPNGPFRCTTKQAATTYRKYEPAAGTPADGPPIAATPDTGEATPPAADADQADTAKPADASDPTTTKTPRGARNK